VFPQDQKKQGANRFDPRLPTPDSMYREKEQKKRTEENTPQYEYNNEYYEETEEEELPSYR
jgi:hypothetical protein